MDDMNLNNMENEDAEDLGPITLVDENGEEQEFELIDTVAYQDETYAVMAPYGDIDDDSDNEVELVILRMVKQDEDITLETVADDDLLDAVYAAFQDQNPDLFEE